MVATATYFHISMVGYFTLGWPCQGQCHGNQQSKARIYTESSGSHLTEES